MRYNIVLAPDAAASLRRMRAYDRVMLLDAVEQHLRHEPTRTNRIRIRALRGMRRPRFRLRIGAHRIFYDVRPGCVEIIAVVSKGDSADWLDRWGMQSAEGGSP